MRRHSETEVAVLCGGGPADGETREVTDGAETVVVHVGPVDPAPGAVQAAHLYERQVDGRFHYAGEFEVENHPEMPAPIHEDGKSLGLAALGHEKGPSGTAIISMITFVIVIMMFYYEYTH